MCLESCSQTVSLNRFCWCFLCYQFQVFWDTSPFAVPKYFWLCPHSHMWTGCAHLVQFRYGTFKICKLGYNIYLYKAFKLPVVCTDDNWSGSGQSKWTDHNELIKSLGKKVWIPLWIHIVLDLCIAQPWCLLQFEDKTAFSAALKLWYKK